MQSFLESLNYYSRFIEDYAVYASILYELREVDFHAWRCKSEINDSATAKEEDEEKWSRVQVAFVMLKNKIATAPILRHFDPAKEAVIIVYASEWAISASLYCGERSVSIIADTGNLFYDVGHPTPQSPDETFDIGVVSQIFRVAGTPGKLGCSLVSVDFRDREV
ncbi:unnamed protein product [Peronospora destructor]|uniref:Uncharacterized protein n=1 Tax=Peronospora destructor TaxID=86335 RepID=A0AAV0VAY1_9STRA|nr:unnamed protein product [Peronospora destructor]